MLVATVTINHTKVDSDLTDFPIFIDLSDLGSVFWGKVKSGGGDIRVYKNDGTTQLAREVVSCDTTAKTGELHVKYTGTLSSTTDTTIQIWADGTSSEPTASSTYGSEAVWSDYKAIYHLGDTDDSTSNGNNGTVNGATSGATGQIENAYDFDGNDDRILLPSTNLDMATAYTLSAWIKIDVTGIIQGIVNRDKLTGSADERVFQFRVDDNEKINFIRFYYSGNLSATVASSTDSISVGNFYKITATFDNSVGSKIYINGSQNGTTNTTKDNNINGTASDIFIAAMENDSSAAPYLTSFLNGIIDEVRITNIAISSAWEKTEYNNQNSPSTFYTASEPATTNESNFFQFF